MFWTLVISFLFLVTLVYAIGATIVAKKYAFRLIMFEDNLEKTLDVLDASYQEIGKLLARPVFYDSPEIKRAIGSLRHAQQAILIAANGVVRQEEEKNVRRNTSITEEN